MRTDVWRREGLVLTPPREHRWWLSHAQAPTILRLSDRHWRVYFGARAEGPQSRIMYADLDPVDEFRVLGISSEPVLEDGRTGAFDSHGMGPATALMVGSQVYLYYTGIVRRADVPYQLAIGLAVSDDNGHSFRRVTDGPLLATGPHDPWFMSTPCVRQTSTGFEMWYSSGVGWHETDGQMEPHYVLRHTRSDDGIFWDPNTRLAVGLEVGDRGLGRSWVQQGGSGQHLWFCSRGGIRFRQPGKSAYRLQEATLCQTQPDAMARQEVAFANPPSKGDWDEWMQAYPCVEPLGEDLVMLYNGNGFGRGGFGRATLPGGALLVGPNSSTPSSNKIPA